MVASRSLCSGRASAPTRPAAGNPKSGLLRCEPNSCQVFPTPQHATVPCPQRALEASKKQNRIANSRPSSEPVNLSKKAQGSEIYHDCDVTARVSRSAVSGGRIQPDYDLNNPRTEESGSHHLSIAAMLRLILISAWYLNVGTLSSMVNFIGLAPTSFTFRMVCPCPCPATWRVVS